MNDARDTASTGPHATGPDAARRVAGGTVTVGTVVRDRLWGGTYTGTVMRREGRSVFVAWHGTAVEDQLDINHVVPWPHAPAELATWRGGVGILDTDGYRVAPMPGGER